MDSHLDTNAVDTRRLQHLLQDADPQRGLLEAAMVLAGARYPALDRRRCMATVAGWCRELGGRLGPDAALERRIELLNDYLFDELGFRGNVSDYYDPDNSYINRVLERRTGIPISLSMVYAHLGRAAGVPLYGVAFPGHFLTAADAGEGVIVVDAFSGGTTLDEADLLELLGRTQPAVTPSLEHLARFLQPASPRRTLVRMLRNLQSIYDQREAWGDTLAVLDLIITVDASEIDVLRERAELWERLECIRPAVRDYRRYLSRAGDSVESDDVRARVAALEEHLPRLH